MTKFISQLKEETPGWSMVRGYHLQKKFSFKNFRQALHFANKVGAVAEKEGHHPDIKFGSGYAKIITYTHTVNGL